MWKNFCFCRLELAKKWELRGAPHIRTERNLRVLGKFCFANFINVGKISSGMENIHGFVNSLKVFSSSWCLFSTLSRTPFSLVYTFLNLKCLSTLSLHFSSIRRKIFWYERENFLYLPLVVDRHVDELLNYIGIKTSRVDGIISTNY